MKRIKHLIDVIDEEIRDAKMYAEMYVDEKASNNMADANSFKSIASEELKHAMTVHDYTVREIERISKVYTPPAEMLDKWDYAHREYVEEVAIIKQMLTM